MVESSSRFLIERKTQIPPDGHRSFRPDPYLPLYGFIACHFLCSSTSCSLPHYDLDSGLNLHITSSKRLPWTPLSNFLSKISWSSLLPLLIFQDLHNLHLIIYMHCYHPHTDISTFKHSDQIYFTSLLLCTQYNLKVWFSGNSY